MRAFRKNTREKNRARKKNERQRQKILGQLQRSGLHAGEKPAYERNQDQRIRQKDLIDEDRGHRERQHPER